MCVDLLLAGGKSKNWRMAQPIANKNNEKKTSFIFIEYWVLSLMINVGIVCVLKPPFDITYYVYSYAFNDNIIQF